MVHMANFIVTTVTKKEWQTDQREVSEVMVDSAEEEEIDTNLLFDKRKIPINRDFSFAKIFQVRFPKAFQKYPRRWVLVLFLAHIPEVFV
jgi:hypothetical protein